VALPVIGITGFADHSARLSSAPLIAAGSSYVRAVELAGGAPVVTPPHPDENTLRAIF